MAIPYYFDKWLFAVLSPGLSVTNCPAKQAHDALLEKSGASYPRFQSFARMGSGIGDAKQKQKIIACLKAVREAERIADVAPH